MSAFLAHLRVLQLKDYLTLANGACGGLAVVMALAKDLGFGMFFVFLGIMFDGLDGVVARRPVRGRATENPFGRELDSLADGVTFGLAPIAVVLAPLVDTLIVAREPVLLLTLLAALFYLACILVRLARFNLQKERGYFEGLPSPLAALAALLGVFRPEWAWLSFLAAGALAASSFRFPKPRLV